MILGILSDTHDQLERTARAVEKLCRAGAEAIIHCGDLTTPDVVYVCAGRPSYFVLGNNDSDVGGIKLAVEVVGGFYLGFGGLVELGGKRLGVAHGDMGRVLRELVAAGPDYLLSGHTHVPHDERRGGIRWINPGALHRARSWTAALLDLEADRLEWVAVC